MYVCHHYGNPACINIDHLFLGTQTDNMQDMAKKGRHVGRRKLTIEQVRDIRKRAVRGMNRWHRGNYHELAEEYGVDKSAISRIVSGDRWGDRE